MKNHVSIVLVGIGGYGEVYLSSLLDDPRRNSIRLVGAVDPVPGNCSRLPELQRLKVPIYPSLTAFYGAARADLAVISSSIPAHCEQTCLALSNDSNVLCEKPAAATIQDVQAMMDARDRSGRFVAIGFQWSFAASIQALKADILAGAFGAPKQLRCLTLWPRDDAYYGRNDWAGRMRTPDGRWILDSPASNAMAHYLHNMLFLLGDAPDHSIRPTRITAETYRANPIESFDTVTARIETPIGADLHFYASHATQRTVEPIFAFAFEDASIKYAGGNAPIIATFDAGQQRRYAHPDRFPQTVKFWDCVAAVVDGIPLSCGLEAAAMHTLCVNGIHESASDTHPFPQSMITHLSESGATRTYAEGLDLDLRRCYVDAALPNELQLPWSSQGTPVDLAAYTKYPSG